MNADAPALPREIQVEVTAACNLRCHMCLVRYRPPVSPRAGSLPFERFRAIVDALPALETVTLQGLGEPLLAPDLFPMIAYAAARGVRVGFNTNATLLTRATAERLLDSGLDWLCVSVDGATAATYEAIREGASFAKVRRNLETLTALMRARGATRPALSIVFVAMRRNVHELPDLVRFAEACGVTTVRVQNLSHSFSDTDPAGAYREIREYAAAEALWDGDDARAAQAVFAEAHRVADEIGVKLRLPELDVAAPAPGVPGCDWPWRSAYVRQDGQVQPCCMLMGGDRAIVGDLGTEDFATIWRGDAYVRFRAALATSAPPDVCVGCAMYRGVF